MHKNIESYLNNLMMPIPGGVEYLRDYRDEQKWISSDSKMSIPGVKGNLTEIEKIVETEAFFLAKYPVTKSLYELVVQNAQDQEVCNSTPIVNVSW